VIGVALLGALLGEPATLAGAHAAEYLAVALFCLASGVALAASKDWRLQDWRWAAPSPDYGGKRHSGSRTSKDQAPASAVGRANCARKRGTAKSTKARTFGTESRPSRVTT
jgi:hypothetical protein